MMISKLLRPHVACKYPHSCDHISSKFSHYVHDKKEFMIVFNLFLFQNYELKLIYSFRLEASLADSLEIFSIAKASKQRHRKNLV